MPQFDGDEDHLVKRKEDRDLDQDRQAARSGVDLARAVQLHHLFLHATFVFAAAFLDRLHLGLQFLHPRHADIGFIGQRQHDDFQHHGQRDDRQAHIADDRVQPVQHGKDRLGQKVEPAPVDGIKKPRNAVVVLVAADRGPFLGAGKQA